MPSPTPAPFKDATATRRGFMGVGDQIFQGIKSFLKPIKLALFSTGGLPAVTEGHVAYDSTLHRLVVRTNSGWVPAVLAVSGGSVASLEEHILDPAAHPGTNIEFISGSFTWGDDSDFNPSNIEEAVVTIIEELSAPGGAAKVRAAPGGGLSGTNVQAQLNELDSEKASSSALAASGGAALVGATVGTVQSSLDTLSAAVAAKAAANDTGIAKAWGYFSTGPSPTLIRGKNVASFSYNSATSIRVTFTTPMTTAVYSCKGITSLAGGQLVPYTRHQNYVDIMCYNPATTSYATLNSGAITFDFDIHE